MVPAGGLAHGGSAEAGMGAEPPGGPHCGDSSGETSWRWIAWGMLFEGVFHQTCWRGKIPLGSTTVKQPYGANELSRGLGTAGGGLGGVWWQ